jgi:hypothetical protein
MNFSAAKPPVGELIAKEHRHDRPDRERIENPGLLTIRESQARQIPENER